MRILLDTHIALWLAVSPARLSERALGVVADVGQELLLSAASVWEISIKCAAGKLALPREPGQFLPDLQRRLKLTVVPIELLHAIGAGALPPLHRDPFDRMLIAQAQLLEVPIMTADPKLAQYEVEVIAG